MNSIGVPRAWKKVRLPEIADLKNGGTPPRANSLFWDGGSVPFVTAADLTTLYVKDGRTFLTEDGLYSGKTIVCEKGDLLIGTRTRVGNCCKPRRNPCKIQCACCSRILLLVFQKHCSGCCFLLSRHLNTGDYKGCIKLHRNSRPSIGRTTPDCCTDRGPDRPRRRSA
jgi:hypothetical protein